MQLNAQGYLPASVRVGQMIRHRPMGCEHTARGRVVQIPSHRRFAVVEYSETFMGLYGVPVSYSFRETLRITPPPEALATSVPLRWEPDVEAVLRAEGPPNGGPVPADAKVALDVPRIRLLMKVLAIPQREIARRLDVSVSAISTSLSRGWWSKCRAADMAAVLGCKSRDIILPQ